MGLSDSNQYLYLIELCIIIYLHRILGYICKKIGVSRVIGDFIGGCLLGPTIMGKDLNDMLFPSENRDLLMIFGQLGLTFTIMSSGLSWDWRVTQKRPGAISLLFLFNHILPILSSTLLYYILPDTGNWYGSKYDAQAFYTFLAVSFAGSALPMAFLILEELKIKTELGELCISLASLSSIGRGIMISTAVFLSTNTPITQNFEFNSIFLFATFVGLVCIQFVWSKVEGKLESINHKLSQTKVHLGTDYSINVIAIVLVISTVTFAIDFTYLLGAFFAGMFTSFNTDLRKSIVENVRWITRWILLPQYFVYVGLKINLRLLTFEDWGWIAFAIFLAVSSKLLISIPIKFLLKYSWHDSLFIAILSTARGLSGLVVAAAAEKQQVTGQAFYFFCFALSIFSSGLALPTLRILQRRNVTVVPTPTRIKYNWSRSAGGQVEETNTQVVDMNRTYYHHLPSGEEEEEEEQSENLTNYVGSFMPSILGDVHLKEVCCLWTSDIKALLSDPVRGIQQFITSTAHRPLGSFTGKELVDWIMKHLNLPFRADADYLAQQFVSRGIIADVTSLATAIYPNQSFSLNNPTNTNNDDPNNLTSILDNENTFFALSVHSAGATFSKTRKGSINRSILII